MARCAYATSLILMGNHEILYIALVAIKSSVAVDA